MNVQYVLVVHTFMNVRSLELKNCRIIEWPGFKKDHNDHLNLGLQNCVNILTCGQVSRLLLG